MPPLDVVEGYMWGREWVIATYKHPALPSWVLEATRIVTGAVGWPAYLVSQLFVAATFVFVYRLGCDLMGRQRAAAGTLLLTGIVYYSWPTPEFNHNVAQTTFWAGFAWALWRAVERQSIRWWMLLGAFGAGGIYAKLSTGLLFLAAAAWIVLDARARRSLATAGPWITLGIVVAAAAPLGLWLVESDFSMLRYAAERSYWSKPEGIHVFVLNAIGVLAGMLAILAVGLIGRRPRADTPPSTPPPIDPRVFRFLVMLIAVPPVLVIVAAVLTQTGLRAAWASSMFNLAGLLAIGLAAGRFDARALQRIAIVALALVIVIPVAYGIAVAVAVAVPGRAKPPLRVQWPGPEIAERMARVWDRATQGAPLRNRRRRELDRRARRPSPQGSAASADQRQYRLFAMDRRAPARGRGDAGAVGRREGSDRPAALHQPAHAAVGAGEIQIDAFPAGDSDPLPGRAANRAPALIAHLPSTPRRQ